MLELERIGVLINPRAGRVSKDPGLVERLREIVSAEQLRVTSDAAAIAPALEEFRNAGIETLVIVGGDGSGCAALTTLLEIWPTDRLPALIFAGGGTINTVPRSLGVADPPDRVLRDMTHNPDQVSETIRSPICVTRPDGPTVAGMIFANGVAPRFLEYYYKETSLGAWGAFDAVINCAGSALFGGKLGKRVFSRFSARLEIDGKLQETAEFSTIVAGSVQHVGLGFRILPTAGDVPDRFHLATTGWSGLDIALRLPGLRLELPSHINGIDHASAKRVVIHTEEPVPYTVDAELFEGASPLILEAGPAIRFFQP